MTDTRLQGARLLLRPVEPGDATATYAGWMNDPEVTRYMETRFTTHTVEGLRDYITSMRAKADTWFMAIVLASDGRHIGNIKLGPIDRVHGLADVALMIGARDCWGQGYAAEAIALISDYAFAALRVRKLTAGCYHANVGSRRAFEKAGYHVEGARRAQYFCDGEYQDGVLLARFHPEFPAAGA